MSERSESGSTLVETVVALFLLGLALTGILPAFSTILQTNTRCENRSNAVAAAQQVLDALRIEDPETLPISGASAPQLLTVGGDEFEVITRFCVVASLCSPTRRQIVVEVQRSGSKVFDVETIFAQLR